MSGILLIALFLAAPSWLAGCAAGRRKPLEMPLEQRLTIVAENFQFIPSTVKVARDKTVVLLLKSGDRGYGVAIEDLGVKAYIPAGKETRIRFRPAEKGEFALRCTAPATPSCLNMRGTIIVE